MSSSPDKTHTDEWITWNSVADTCEVDTTSGVWLADANKSDNSFEAIIGASAIGLTTGNKTFKIKCNGNATNKYADTGDANLHISPSIITMQF